MKQIEGFPNHQVTQDGRVISNTRRTAVEMKFTTTPNGYLLIMLYDKGKRIARYVHRLVAQAFIPNPHNLPCVNHKDGNKQNNHISNLEWCTYQHNQRHAFDNGLHPLGEDRKAAKLTEEQVKYIRSYPQHCGYRIKLSEQFDVCIATIDNAINRKTWKHI